MIACRIPTQLERLNASRVQFRKLKRELPGGRIFVLVVGCFKSFNAGEEQENCGEGDQEGWGPSSRNLQPSRSRMLRQVKIARSSKRAMTRQPRLIWQQGN